MARKPKYRRHTTRDLGFVEHAGKRHYLPGPFRSDESVAAYYDFLRANGFSAPSYSPTEPHRAKVVGVVAERFRAWASDTYPDTPRSEAANVRAALRLLVEFCDPLLPLAEFTPRKLKEFQAWLANRKLTRTYLNAVVSRIKRMFKWAASEQLVTMEMYLPLTTVVGVRKGRTVAREPVPRRPVEWSHVEPVLQELKPVVAAMVRLHWFTGARSGSICKARPAQFNRETTPWAWSPRHKTESLEHALTVYIGPQAREAIAWLFDIRKPNEFLFQPKNVAGKRSRGYRAFYDSVSYLRAVKRAIERVNQKREAAGEKPIPYWTPHQIRHSRGTLVREQHGLEAAQAALGHSQISATQIYARQQIERAKYVAETMG